MDGDAITQMENSGEGTVCKFMSLQMNYSMTFNLLMLGNGFMVMHVLWLVHALSFPNR